MVALTEFADITAVIITRGDTDLSDLLESLPYGEILVDQNGAVYRWDGTALLIQHTHKDSKVYNRFIAASYAQNDTIFFQDDDVRVPDHQGLLDAFNSRRHLGDWVANTQPGLDEAQGYFDLALVGCGSLVPRNAWLGPLARYRAEYGGDDRFDLDCDFIFGTLSHWVKVDLGLDVLEVASADNRLWKQPGQLEGKHESIAKARALRTIVLTMLAKNEEAQIVRALDSARELFDSVLIHDTGSTDSTVLEVSRWCSANGIPFRIEEDVPFEGFGAARNALMDDAHAEADYMLLMDADEELAFSEEDELHRPPLFADCYTFHYEGPLDYAQPRLLYTNFGWRFDEVQSHAALDSSDGRHPIGCDMASPLIRHHGWNRGGTQSRYERDVTNLSDDINNSREVSRSLFMRGKAYEGMFAMTSDEKYRDLAIEDYRARVEISQGDEESFYSRFRLGCLLVESGKFASGADELFSAWIDRPRRIESLRALSAYCTAVADATPYPVGDMIIVHRDLYRDHPNTEGA